MEVIGPVKDIGTPMEGVTRHREKQTMAATALDTNLESREARSLLAFRHKPYWRLLDQGCQLGYYKGEDLRVWIARFPRGKGRYAEQRVGLADDFAGADGVAVMDFRQARAAARNWFAEQAIKHASPPIDDRPFNIAAPCFRD